MWRGLSINLNRNWRTGDGGEAAMVSQLLGRGMVMGRTRDGDGAAMVSQLLGRGMAG